MKVSCTYAARMMLVLLLACLAWGTPAAAAQEDCCSSILELTITQASSDECCFTVSGKIQPDRQCFRGWRIEEYVSGAWVSVSPSLVFNSDGSFSYTICGAYGPHVIRVLFIGYDGRVLCEKRMEYQCDQAQDCCDFIYGPYVESVYNDGGKCCFRIFGTVGQIGIDKCFRYINVEIFKDGAWQNDGSYGFNPDGSFSFEKCVETGVYQFRILFYGHDGRLLCIKEFTLNCESSCCEYIQGPYIYPDDSADECCFTIKGTVGERGRECFGYWEFERFENGSWINDGMSYNFDPDGTFSIYKCLPYGVHQMRILFYSPDGRLLCVKELEYNCQHSCCDLIQGPYVAAIDSHDGQCCYKFWGSVTREGIERCFKYVEFAYEDNGTWINDGAQYPFDGNGNFSFVRCLPPGHHNIQIFFYDSNRQLVCTKRLEVNCEVDCCRTIDGPYITTAPVEPRPGYCCFTISGKVGQNNRCFKYMQLEIFQNGAWVNVGATYYFNPDGSFAFTHCVPVGSYQLRVLFFDSNGNVICRRELDYSCTNRCCETIQGPNIYPATIEPRPGMCCFTISGTVGEGNRCFKWWEYEQLIGGVWVNDMMQYPFNPDGSFSITKCVTPGTHQIRILFRDSNGRVICTKELTYTCRDNCCETIQGPFIGPATFSQPGRCCFIVSGTVGQRNPCFSGWQYEHLENGVWVNDLVTYPFNPDGSFAITKCVPYGTHQIRIIFLDPNGRRICVKELRYTCEGDCCESIQGPNVYPATDVDSNKCCFVVKGSIGENNPCFSYWQYEELIGGVWVNDLMNYPFAADGSFGILKCGPFGTHQIRILFFDVNGKLICRRELTYTCESECCRTIDGPYIFPAVDPVANRCCFTIKGSIGECNPCFKYWQYEELINGVWVNDAVNYLFNADGTFSITKCGQYGVHIIRILFYDYNGDVICIKNLRYECEPNPHCCETIQGPFITTTVADPNRCCFIISGSVGRDNPCFRSFDIEHLENGVWVNDMVSYIFQPDGSYSVTKCVASGTHTYRLLFRDFNGRVICERTFTYTCKDRCCETIQGPFIQTVSTTPNKCCFRIYGSVGPNNPCFRNFEIERFVNGVWINDMVSYIFQPNGSFSITKCVGPGIHQFRMLFRDQNGRVICVKEFEYRCSYYDCCERIQGPVITPLLSPTGRCCFKISGSVGAENPCFRSYEFEELINGVWVNDMVSYVFNPDGSFSLNKCLGPGLHTMRLIFRDQNGAIICVKQFEYNCGSDCCQTIQGPYVAPDASSLTKCCFKIYGSANPHCFQSVEFEVFLNGQWVNDMTSYVITASGTFTIYKCLPRGVTYTMRLLFRDYTGRIICTRQFTYGCPDSPTNPPDALKANPDPRAVSSGVVQNLASVPNPASDEMTISYDLSEESPVRVSLFSHIGQEVMVIDDGVKSAGKQSLPVNITRLASGVYIVRLTVNGAAVDLPVTIVK